MLNDAESYEAGNATVPGLYLKLMELPPFIIDWADVNGICPVEPAPKAVILGDEVLGPLNISMLSDGHIFILSMYNVIESAHGAMVKPGQFPGQLLRA